MTLTCSDLLSVVFREVSFLAFVLLLYYLQHVAFKTVHACAFCVASAAHQKLHGVDGFPVRDSDGLVLIGLSVCWGARDAYYVSLQQEQSKGTDAYMHTFMLKLAPKSVSLVQPVCVTPQV